MTEKIDWFVFLRRKMKKAKRARDLRICELESVLADQLRLPRLTEGFGSN